MLWYTIYPFRFRVEKGVFMRVSLVERDASKSASSRLTRAFALAVSCSLFIFSAYAQSDRGTITGSVTDPSSAVVAGAKVEVRNLDNGSILQGGHYQYRWLHHHVRAERKI